MAKKTSKEENWVQAYRQARKAGVVLTRRRNSKGQYVCYMSKESLGLLGNL